MMGWCSRAIEVLVLFLFLFIASSALVWPYRGSVPLITKLLSVDTYYKLVALTAILSSFGLVFLAISIIWTLRRPLLGVPAFLLATLLFGCFFIS